MKRILHNISILFLLVSAVAMLGSCHSSKKSGPGGNKKHDREVLVEKKKNKGKGLSGQQKMIVEEAYSWLGTPYAYAHAEKGVATDCSGMVLSIYQTVSYTHLTLPTSDLV